MQWHTDSLWTLPQFWTGSEWARCGWKPYSDVCLQTCRDFCLVACQFVSFVCITLLRQSPKWVQHNLKTSSCRDANWLSVASVGTVKISSWTWETIAAHFPLPSWLSSLGSSTPRTKHRTQLTLCLNICHPSVPLPAQLSGSAGSPAGYCVLPLGRLLGCSWGPDALSALRPVMFGLEFVQGFLLCEKRLLLFSFSMQRGFFRKAQAMDLHSY